jgi:Antirepressor regulating drug resistance, predicted signal transduction N-terminal membrane component
MIQYANAVADYLISLPFPALLILKSSIVLILGALVAVSLHRFSASMRYAVWALALTATVVLPIGMLTAPSWSIQIPQAPEIVSNPSVEPIAEFPQSSGTTTLVAPPAPQSTPVDLSKQDKLLIVWLAGTVLLLGRMIAARFSLARLTRKSTLLDDIDWMRIINRESARLGLDRRVRLFASERVSTPLAAGIADAFIVVPSSSSEWNDEHKEIVLRHELSHIARGDAFICILSGIACAVYWFNPLVWIASRKLRAEQERACDDSVITLGTPPVEYAAHLLEVARSARDMGMSSFVSVAMARPSQLEGRLLAVLNSRSRNSLTRTRSAGAVMITLLLVLAVSALRPVRAESAVIVASQIAPPVFVTAVVPETPHEPVIKSDSTVSGDVKVESGGTLVLDLKTGAGVTIRGTNENRVHVEGTLSGRDWRNTSFSVRGNEGDAFVKMDYLERTRSFSSSHSLRITVPRRFNVRINSSGGEISIRDVEGSFTGGTGGGEITMENVRGSARLTTGGGEVTVQNSNLTGSVTTGGGAVLIQNVTGGLSGSSGTGDVLYGGSSARERGSPFGEGRGRGISGGVSGSVKGGVTGTVAGDVTFSGTTVNGMRTSSDGKYYVSKSGGSVTIADAKNGAVIQTGGGAISIGKTNGDLYAQTGGGDVTVAAADGAVEITTGAGDVEINLTESGHPVKIASGNGNVTLILPRGTSADLDLETAYTRSHGPTRIRGDWSLSTTETTSWDTSMGTPRRYIRSEQPIGGGGPRIRVKTVNGDIIVKRR